MNQRQVRAQNVSGVIEIFKAVHKIPKSALSEDDLFRIGIKVADLDLLTGKSNDLGP